MKYEITECTPLILYYQSHLYSDVGWRIHICQITSESVVYVASRIFNEQKLENLMMYVRELS